MGPSPLVFPIDDLKYVFSLPPQIVDNNRDNRKMIADIEQRFIESLQSIDISHPDEILQEWRVNESMRVKQQPQQPLYKSILKSRTSERLPPRGPSVGGKRSINSKRTKRVRRPLRRKSSATKRLRRRRRSNRRTTRK